MLYAVLLATGLLAACGGKGSSADVSARDSAGVTIVENPAAAVEAAPRWNVGPEPVVDIGTVAGDPGYQLSDVADVTRLSDGTLVVAHDDPPELRFYDADGEHVRTVGGEGKGPGEFQSAGVLMRLEGDTLLVDDWRLKRVSRFAPDGTFLESQRLETQTVARVVGRLSDGSLVGRGGAVFGAGRSAEEGVVRRDSPLFVLRPDGTVRDTLVVRRGRRFYVSGRGGGPMVVAYPVSTAPHEAVGPDAVYTAHGRAWEVRVLGPDGDVRRIVRLDRERRPLTDSRWNEAVEERTAGIEDPSIRKQQEALYADMPVPDRLPAFDDMRIGAAGDLWLREVRADPPESAGKDRWIVFGPDGRVRAVALLPSGVQPLEIARDRVVGSWTDELDVPRLRVYRLEREEGGTAG